MYEYRVKEVLRVVDGDTCDLEIDLGFSITITERIRLLELDTEEKRGGTDFTKDRASLATARLNDLLLKGPVTIKTHYDRTGKYGRTLGWLFVETDSGIVDVNKTMVAEGFQKGTTTPIIESIQYKD